MVTLYPGYCEKFGWMLDESAVEAMKSKNDEKVKELDAKYAPRLPRRSPLPDPRLFPERKSIERTNVRSIGRRFDRSTIERRHENKQTLTDLSRSRRASQDQRRGG
jgi:hypothetical protein